MVKNKSFFFDLDGTLLGKNKEISTKTINFLKKLRKNNKIGIATGRPAYMIKKEIRQIKPDLPVLSINGGLITDKFGNLDSPIYINCIDKKTHVETIKKLKELKLNFLIYTPDSMYYWNPKSDSPWCKWLKETHESRKKSEKWNFEALDSINYEKINVIKFLVLLENKSVKFETELKNFVKKHPKIWGLPSQAQVFDIMRLGVSKGKALSILEDKNYLKTNDLIVFGDAANDISMFDASGYSVAMQNADSKAKKSANSVTKFSNEEDGVIKWIEANINAKNKD